MRKKHEESTIIRNFANNIRKNYMIMRKVLFCLMAMMGVLTVSAQSVYDFTVKDDTGKDVSLAEYKGKVLLIVNTATRCGFTPQYK